MTEYLPARGGKMLYKGDIIHLLARLLALIPNFLLYLMVVAGALVWLPWRTLADLRTQSGAAA